MNKQLLFSVTRNDLEIQTFCTGGNGGQHRNAKQNGVRIIHKASGARAEHRDGRDQPRNRAEAFRKLAETPQFKAWHRAEVARRLGLTTFVQEHFSDEAIARRVDTAMAEENLKVEYL